MITAVDSSVLLDVLLKDSQFSRQSEEALLVCSSEGPLVVCEVVWAEVGGWFSSSQELDRIMAEAELAFAPLSQEASFQAGRSWRAYRRAGGPRSRILSDFLIAAHALVQADRLLTRDRGFYRRYFEALVVVDPRER